MIAADISSQKIALYYADQFYTIPPDHSKEFVPALIKLCRLENIQLIVPSRDGELKILSDHTLLFAQNNIKLMVAQPSTIDICLDKFQFYQFCKKNNFQAVKTVLADNLSEIAFPAFIKPRIGSGAQNNYIAETLEKLQMFLSLYDNEVFIIQPFIDFKEYTIDLFSDFNSKVVSVIPRQRMNICNGESIVAKTVNNQVLIQEATNLAQSLGLIGHNTIQCFYDDIKNKVIFIEVNPRYGGGASLGFSAGAFTPDYVIQLLKGKTPQFDQNTVRDNQWMFKYHKCISVINKNDIYYQPIGQEKIFCIDIDGTICTEHCSYEDAKPINHIIEKINFLYQQGHKIILFTSRGYASGYDWLPLLENQMKQWGVSYHELKQGKPFADYYIDNKALNVLDWF